jgi:cytochrome c553
MNKISITLLVLASALCLSACSGGEAGHESAANNATSVTRLPEGRIDIGRELATKGGEGIAACATCHGADGSQPLDGMYPKISGQYADYLAYSLMHYRAGERSGGTAELMIAQAKPLTDQQIADVAAYYASQPSQLRDLQNIN